MNALTQTQIENLPTYDAASDTYIDPDAPVVICDKHTARDIDPMSGRCWECGERVAIEA